MSDFDRQRERQRGGQSVRDGGDISSTATPGKQTLAPGAGASAPATQAAPAPAPAPASRSPFDAAAEPIRDHLNRARQLLVRLTTARASNDRDKVTEVSTELRSCLQSAREGIEHAPPSPAIDALRPQLAEAEHQAALFLNNAAGPVRPTVLEATPAMSGPASQPHMYETPTSRSEGNPIHDPGAPSAEGTGLQRLTGAVERAERLASSLRDKTASSPANAKATITSQAANIYSELTRAQMGLQQDHPLPTDVRPLAERLSEALVTVFAVARHDDLAMRETHLEEVFDAEDEIRMNYAGLERVGRAEAYYDVNLQRANNEGNTPDASSLATKALDGSEDGFSKDVDPKESFYRRDDVVNSITAFGGSVGRALSTGLGKAKTLITEPEQQIPPDFADQLVDAVITILTAQGSTMLGALIGAAVGAGVKAVGAEQLPRKISDAIVDGYKDSLKDVVLSTAKRATNKVPEAPRVSARSVFLDAADKQAAKATDHVAAKFQSIQRDLKRTPVKELLNLSEALSGSLLDEIETRYTDIVVHQWINLLHDADKRGVDVQHPQRGGRSKLDDLDHSVGTVKIAINVGLDGSLSLRSAQLVGVSGAIREHIREEGERNTLRTLPLQRTIRAIAPLPPDEQVASASEPIDGFDLDVNSNLTPPDVLSIRQRRAWISIARRLPSPTAGAIFDGSLEGSDADVYKGMNKVVEWLGTIPASKVAEENE